VSILVVGDVMVDVVAVLPGELAHGSDTPGAIEHHFGGSGANVAAWLGDRGLLAARIGADPLGEAAVAGLRGPIERDAERATGTCIVLVHPGGERTMIPDAGANDAVELRVPSAPRASAG
jgi:sugar/nucleoside kinase (ribokinase family)